MTSDAALVTRAEGGDDTGYDELHRRHVLAAWGLAQAITRDDVTALAAVDKAMPAVFAAIGRGSYPPGLSVRSAVLAAARAAALSMLHSSTWTGSPYGRDVIDRAFSGLPECWRSALWLTEVERLRPVEAARPLRVDPGEAATLAERARAGFTDRYIRLAGAGRDPECRVILAFLPGLAARTLAPHQTADVDQHLAACRPCRTSSLDLADVGATIRSVALPTPLLAMKGRDRRTPRPAAAGPARFIPALAAVIAALLGFSSMAAFTRDVPSAAQQVASPIETRRPVRDPGAVRSLAPPIATPADVDVEASSLTQAPIDAPLETDGSVVAMSERAEAAPADLDNVMPPSAPRSLATGRPTERAAGGVAEAPDPASAAPAPQHDGSSAPGGEAAAPPPPAEPAPEPEPEKDPGPVVVVAVTAEVGGATATVAIDPASTEPVELDVSIPGPSEGHSVLGSGA